VEFMGVTMDADISNRGFSLTYRQIPCEWQEIRNLML
jgi:hypothetical protein